MPRALASAALFDLLWATLSEVLGTAATATLLRRACRRAVAHRRELEALSIAKSGLVYTFTLPDAWRADADAPADGMRALLDALRPILVELTGSVLVQRLDRLTEFQRRGLVTPQEGPK